MIYLSAGHYPEQPGACSEGFCEHEEAVVWANLIQEFMGAEYATVIPTGTVRQKAKHINARDPTAVVEIHFNASRDPKSTAEGFLIMYQPGSDKSKQLSALVYDGMSDVLLHGRGEWVGWYRLKQSNGLSFILKEVTAPTILIEPEFIHNAKAIRDMRQRVCREIAEALHLFTKDPEDL